MKDVIRETLAFKELTEEEKQKRGILGRLYGPIADTVRPTRNGRGYTDELWSNVFEKNEIIQEMFDNGGIFGELDHPTDRDELCSEKIAICMPEKPKKDKDGHLIGYFDILDTPCGRIAYQLAKYGYKLGISSRGNGDVLADDTVDPETYDFKCFDLVIVPSVKDARLTMTEGLDGKMLNIKTALKESLDSATADERKVMEETLKDLNIKLDESIDENRGDIVGEGTTVTVTNESTEASNVGTNELVKGLQEILKEKLGLEAQVQSLQSELAVSNTKVDKLNEELGNYKSTTVRLSNIAKGQKDLLDKISKLEEALKVKEKTITSQQEEIQRLTESKESETSKTTTLNESLNTKDSEIERLNESLKEVQEEYEDKLSKVNEELENEKQTNTSKLNALQEKLTKSTRLCEDYKSLAQKAVNKYIDQKALMIGVDSNEIKNKLPVKYTLTDIDRVCESLQQHVLNMNKLPFSVNRKVNRVTVTESTNESLKPENPLVDDEVDELTLKLANSVMRKSN